MTTRQRVQRTSTLEQDLAQLVGEALGLGPDGIAVGDRLAGHVAELDSMAVMQILTLIEDRFGLTIEDDEVGMELFESVASLASFVERRRRR